MQTTVIYDAYISSEARQVNTPLGKLEYVRIGNQRNNLSHTLLGWDISHIDLVELKIDLTIGKVQYTDTTYIDLYSLAYNFNEGTVTWNNAPKTELLSRNILQLSSSQIYEGRVVTLDLSDYIDKIQNGICLKISNSTPNGSIVFQSSESNNSPILIYSHGEKPDIPIFTSPYWGSLIDQKSTTNIRFTWDSVSQTNYIFEYSQDNYNWTEMTGTSSKYVNIPVSKLKVGNLYARVKIKSKGLWSNYSQTWFIQLGEKPTTPIVTISSASTSKPQISWNKNIIQNFYQVQVLENNKVIEELEEIRGSETSYIIKNRLKNNTTYLFKVKIADENKIWSDFGSKSIKITFTKPDIPEFVLYTNNRNASTTIKIVDQEATIGEKTLYHEIYRCEGSSKDNLDKSNDNWELIASNIKSEYTDMTSKINNKNKYKVRAIGVNGYSDSIEKVNYITNRNNFLAIARNPNKFIILKYNEKKSQSSGYKGELLHFSGRTKPVVEYSNLYRKELSLSFEITSKDDLDLLESIIDSNETLIYRDQRGRKILGHIPGNLEVSDLDFRHYDVKFTLVETDFNGVI